MKGKKHRPEQNIKKLREAEASIRITSGLKDFIHDRTAAGRPLRWLAITDEFTRECLALEVDRSLTAERVLDVLTNLFLTRGVPRHIRSDNGPEFIAQAIRRHAEQAGLEMLYVEPGDPWENGFGESFFSRLRDEPLI